MSRTSISVDEETKASLENRKREDETWDEFLLRLAGESGDGMEPGTLSSEEHAEIMTVVRDGRQR
jgi:hypothetical protein